MSKVHAKDHESYTTFTLITLLIPLIGFILGIVYLTKESKLHRKLGEHLVVISIIATLLWMLILSFNEPMI